MINTKFYNDIKTLPDQVVKGYSLAGELKINHRISKLVVCGMGGSSFYADMVNDLFQDQLGLSNKIETVKTYNLPVNISDNCLLLIVSNSGTTEEMINLYSEAKEKNLNRIIVSSGGELLSLAQKNHEQVVAIPKDVVGRLATGYFLGLTIGILEAVGLVKFNKEQLFNDIKMIKVDEENLRSIANDLLGKTVYFYSSDINYSLANFAKIRFNENPKVQSVANFFPEVNHNEMAGFTHLVSKPAIVLLPSKFSHPRINKRMQVFSDLFKAKGIPVITLKQEGNSFVQEFFNYYKQIDFLSYFLAEAMNYDPEPDELVLEFKSMLGK